ncbi:MAG TPA: hypothetical protein VKY73_10580 [Polyangiaceae bacterium]|nr:hypothetical protein [Polyangiaceae bacterium]
MPNKGRPSKQHPDERKELEQETLSDPQPPKTIHRFDRSAEDEKGGTGAGVVYDDRRLPSGGPQKTVRESQRESDDEDARRFLRELLHGEVGESEREEGG